MIIFNVQIKINNMFTETVINNIRKIMNDSNLTQAAMASYIGVSPSQFSKILSGTVQFKPKSTFKSCNFPFNSRN